MVLKLLGRSLWNWTNDAAGVNIRTAAWLENPSQRRRLETLIMNVMESFKNVFLAASWHHLYLVMSDGVQHALGWNTPPHRLASWVDGGLCRLHLHTQKGTATDDICARLQSRAMGSLGPPPNSTCECWHLQHTWWIPANNLCNDLGTKAVLSAQFKILSKQWLTNMISQDIVTVLERCGNFICLSILVFISVLADQVEAM